MSTIENAKSKMNDVEKGVTLLSHNSQIHSKQILLMLFAHFFHDASQFIFQFSHLFFLLFLFARDLFIFNFHFLVTHTRPSLDDWVYFSLN
jgi:hypothetical protein